LKEKEYNYELYDGYIIFVWWDPVMLTFASRIERDGSVEFKTDLLNCIYNVEELETIIGYEIPDDIKMQLVDDFDNSDWPNKEEYFMLELFRSSRNNYVI
jgi:hypothetical protein